jgi:protein MpaA
MTRAAAAGVLLVIVLPAALARGGDVAPARAAPSSITDSARVNTSSLVLGYSAGHRPIVATLVAGSRSRHTVLVVGSIAGDEPGGTAVTKALASLGAVPGVRLWLIPDMNPDGAARGTRVNANGVDLNRNFPFRWHRLAAQGSRYYPGPRPSSEPESRAIEAFIRRVRPELTLWLHQPYGLIDDSQGPLWAERMLSRTTGLPLARLSDFPGSAIGWEDHLIPASAFDLELPGQLSEPATCHYAAAIRTLTRPLGGRTGSR